MRRGSILGGIGEFARKRRRSSVAWITNLVGAEKQGPGQDLGSAAILPLVDGAAANATTPSSPRTMERHNDYGDQGFGLDMLVQEMKNVRIDT